MRIQTVQNELRRLRGHFTKQDGNYTWDILWEFHVEPTDRQIVEFCIGRRYRASGLMRTVERSELPLIIEERLGNIERAFEDWIHGKTDQPDVPEEAYNAVPAHLRPQASNTVLDMTEEETALVIDALDVFVRIPSGEHRNPLARHIRSRIA